jgi:hypothetical protein
MSSNSHSRQAPPVEDTHEEQIRTATRGTEQHRARDTERDPERAVPEPEHGTPVGAPDRTFQISERN